MVAVLLSCTLSLLAASNEDISAALLEDYTACGQVCLYAVARLKDIDADFERVKTLLGAPHGGQHSLAEIERAAGELGMFPVAVRVNRLEVLRLPVPAIAHVKHSFVKRGQGQSHFVVLLQAREDSALVLDPPFRPAFVAWKRFEKEWTGNLLFFVDTAEASERWRAAVESAVEHGLKRSLTLSGALLLFTMLVIVHWGRCKALLGGAVRPVHPWETFAGLRLLAAGSAWRRWIPKILSGIVLILGCLVFGAMAVWVIGSQKTPRLKTPGEVVDLGEFAPGQVKTTIALRNEGARALKIERIATSCGCAVPATPPEIAPGGTCDLGVSVAVTPGPRSAELVLFSNDPRGPRKLSLRWHGSATPQLLPPRISAEETPLNHTYQRTVHIVYPGGRSAIMPEVVGVQCDAPEIQVSTGKNDPCAFSAARTPSSGKTTVGYLAVDVRVQSPTQPGTIESPCQIAVRYGKNRYTLTLPVTVPFVAPVRAEPPRLLFSETTANAIVGKERRIWVVIDANAGTGTLQMKECPEWLACDLERVSATEYGLYARVIKAPRNPCQTGKIVMSAGPLASSDISVDVLTFALRE